MPDRHSAGTVQAEPIRSNGWGGGVGGMLFTMLPGRRFYNSCSSRGDLVSTLGTAGATIWQAAYEVLDNCTAEDGGIDQRQC